MISTFRSGMGAPFGLRSSSIPWFTLYSHNLKERPINDFVIGMDSPLVRHLETIVSCSSFVDFDALGRDMSGRFHLPDYLVQPGYHNLGRTELLFYRLCHGE